MQLILHYPFKANEMKNGKALQLHNPSEAY